MQLTPEDKLLLSVVTLTPSAQELKEIDTLLPQLKEWDNFVSLLIAHGSAPLLYKKLALLENSNLIPTEVKTKLQHAYYKTLSRSMVLYQAFAELIQALQTEGVQPIILKGVHLSELLYGDIALRQFSDIDILVPVSDGEKSLEVLSNMGFKPREMHPISDFVSKNSDFVHYPPMEKGEISVEVHIKLHTRSAHYQLSIPDIWSRATNVIINKQKVKVLSTEDLLMHLCIHADKHFIKGAIQLKSFNDIVNILEQLKSGYDWEHFERMCVQYKCELVVFNYLVLVAKFYQAALPENLMNKYAYCLNSETEKFFIGYLRNESYITEEPQSAVPGHINSLLNIKSFRVFVKYLIEVIFPSKEFMIDKYFESKEQRAKNKEQRPKSKDTGIFKLYFWWLWYPYRWWVGVKGVVKLFFNS